MLLHGQCMHSVFKGTRKVKRFCHYLKRLRQNRRFERRPFDGKLVAQRRALVEVSTFPLSFQVVKEPTPFAYFLERKQYVNLTFIKARKYVSFIMEYKTRDIPNTMCI